MLGTFDLNREGMRHNLAEAGHIEHDAFFQFETPVKGYGVAERKDVHETGAMLHPMRQARTREAEVPKSVLEPLEVSEALNNNGDVHVVGHPRRASFQKQLRDKRANDSEWDAELAQATLEIRHDRNEGGLNA